VTGHGALGGGLRAARGARRIIACVWAVDLVLAALAAVPFLRAFDGATAERMDGGALAARLDERLFMDFVARHHDLYAQAELRLVVVTALGVLLHALAAGGLLETLGPHAAARPGVRAFLAAAARHAGRMLVVSGVAAGVVALAGLALHGPLAVRLDEVARGLDRDRMRLIVRLVPGLSFLLVLGVVGLLADAWRACVVVRAAPVARALRLALGFVRRRLRVLLVVLGGGLALTVAGVATFAVIDGLVPQGRWPAILLVVTLGQALMLWRHAVRAAVIAAEARLCDMDADPEAWADADIARWGREAGGEAHREASAGAGAPASPRLAGPGGAC
jgi:hypothetical protein